MTIQSVFQSDSFRSSPSSLARRPCAHKTNLRAGGEGEHVVAKATDVWLELTKTVVELLRDLKSEGEKRSPAEVADAAISAFSDVADIESYRPRLEQFVRDIGDVS